MRRVNLLTWHQLHPIDVHLTTASSHGLPSTCTSGSLLVRTMKLTPRIMNLLRSIDLFAWNNDGGGGTSESNGDTKGRRVAQTLSLHMGQDHSISYEFESIVSVHLPACLLASNGSGPASTSVWVAPELVAPSKSKTASWI
jgi:hypothetical protein